MGSRPVAISYAVVIAAVIAFGLACLGWADQIEIPFTVDDVPAAPALGAGNDVGEFLGETIDSLDV